jgi:hypothetical protein
MNKIIFVLLLFCAPLFSQTFALQPGYPIQYGGGYEFYFKATAVDSGDHGTQVIAEITDFDGNLSSYPWAYYVQIDTLSANDEIIGVYLQGKTAIGNWTDLDTLLAPDTVNGSHTGLSSLIAKGTLNLNGWRAPQYRVQARSTHDSGNTFTIETSIYCYKRE